MNFISLKGYAITDTGRIESSPEFIFTNGYANFDVGRPEKLGEISRKFAFIQPGVGVLVSKTGGTGKSTFIKDLGCVVLKHGERDASSVDATDVNIIKCFTAVDLVRELFAQLKTGVRLVAIDSAMRYMVGGKDGLSAGGFNFSLGAMFADLGSQLRETGQTVLFVLNPRRPDNSAVDDDTIFRGLLKDIESSVNFYLLMEDFDSIKISYAHDTLSNGVRVPTRPTLLYLKRDTMDLVDDQLVDADSDKITVPRHVTDSTKIREKKVHIVANPGQVLRR